MDLADMPETEPPPDQESHSLMADEVEAKPKAGLKLDSVTIRPAKNGGFIAQCSKSAQGGDGSPGPGAYESNDYAFSSIDEVHRFIDQELGGATPAAAAANTTGPAIPTRPGGVR